jgi:hypothetical protein
MEGIRPAEGPRRNRMRRRFGNTSPLKRGARRIAVAAGIEAESTGAHCTRHTDERLRESWLHTRLDQRNDTCGGHARCIRSEMRHTCIA